MSDLDIASEKYKKAISDKREAERLLSESDSVSNRKRLDWIETALDVARAEFFVLMKASRKPKTVSEA